MQTAKVTYSMFNSLFNRVPMTFLSICIEIDTSGCQAAAANVTIQKKIWNYMIESFFIAAKNILSLLNIWNNWRTHFALVRLCLSLLWVNLLSRSTKKHNVCSNERAHADVFWCEKKCCRRQNHTQPVNRTNSKKSARINRVPRIDFVVVLSPKLASIVIQRGWNWSFMRNQIHLTFHEIYRQFA